MHAELRRDLTRAIAARDAPAVSALRSALAAIENAAAVPVPQHALQAEPPATAEGRPDVAGTALGVGATEVERRLLTPGEVGEVVAAEATERLTAASRYDELGRPDRAERLRAEAAVLSRYL